MSQNTSEVIVNESNQTAREFCLNLLALLDGQYRKVTVDAYALQTANARNYFWMFFVILSFAAAFFKEAELGAVFIELFSGETVSTLGVFLLLSFFGAVGSSIAGFWIGVGSVSGNNLPFPYQDLPEGLVELDVKGSNAFQQWTLARSLIDRTYIALLQSYETLEKRGKKLRMLAMSLRCSLLFLLAAIVLYGVFYLTVK